MPTDDVIERWGNDQDTLHTIECEMARVGDILIHVWKLAENEEDEFEWSLEIRAGTLKRGH